MPSVNGTKVSSSRSGIEEVDKKEESGKGKAMVDLSEDETFLSESETDDVSCCEGGEDSVDTVIGKSVEQTETTDNSEVSSEEKEEEEAASLVSQQKIKGKISTQGRIQNGKKKETNKGKKAKKGKTQTEPKKDDGCNLAGSKTPTMKTLKQQELDSFLGGTGKRDFSQAVSPSDSTESPDHQRLKLK